ncbi:MAG: hypothetical protein M3505_12370 [Verrucomicrobiota bacterium]|nr:hypothetical protein [Verrucomicrobiota bacterium]
MADEKATEVAQVREGALDLPASAIAAHGASILQGGAAAPTAMWTDQLDPPCGQPDSEALRVVSAIKDKAGRTIAWSARASSRHLHSFQRFFREGDFCGAKR